MWPFRRKDGNLPISTKSASFLFGASAYRGTLNRAAFDQLALEGYAANPIVNACINKISASIASVEPHLYRRGKDGKLTKVETHALLDLIESPNPTQSGKEFMRYLVSYYLTGGNAYIYGNGIDPSRSKPTPPTELQLLNPGKVKVVPGKTIYPLGYEYKPDPNTTQLFPVEQIGGNSAIMQFKTFNPLDQWYGMAPMMAAAFGIDIHNGGQKWNKRLLDNDARPSGAVVVKDQEGKPTTLTEDQYTRLKEQIDEQMSGSANAGKPLLLEGGLEWQAMSMTSKDIDFLKGKDSSARDIGLVFGVPSQLLQIPGDSTFANYEQANLSYWQDTVIPLLCWFLEGLNRWLTPLFGDDLYLWYDEESITALEPRRKEKAERINASQTMTINEKRRAMGMDDLPNGIGDALVLDGRGIMLGMDGSIIALATNMNTDPSQDPLIDPTAQQPEAQAKFTKWLAKQGYTSERAEHLAKLVYG
ncbi:phage portal protein [soil metagenome]